MWTPDALASEAGAWAGNVWRVVESQSVIATNRLVDTLAEQSLLEHILDRSKPAFPSDCATLHYLLATPFRYAPYPHGSRFRRALQPEGCFYAAETVETAIAEQAFYRLLFFLEAPSVAPPDRAMEHTAFAVPAAGNAVIDLTAPPLSRDSAAWTHPTDYGACQDLADAARAAAITAIRYRSVRDPAGGMNVALLSTTAFQATEPTTTQTWHVFVRPHVVQAFREVPRRAMEFARRTWADDPRIGKDGGRDRD